MKGFLLTFVILLVVAAVVFFLGWVQFSIDAGEHAVLFTKTHGWEQDVIEAGTFVWRWQGVFPTVLSTYIFPDISADLTVSLDSNLPAAELYASYLPDTPGFAYQANFHISYNVKPDQLPQLARDRGLRPDTTDVFLDDIDAEITSRVQSIFRSRIAEIAAQTLNPQTAEFFPEEVIMASVADSLTSEFPYLEISSVTAENFRVPDLELYRIARTRYLSVIDTEASALGRAEAELARINIINAAHQQSLTSLGEILDTHESLLSYLTVVAQTGQDPIGLSNMFQDVVDQGAQIGDLLPSENN